MSSENDIAEEENVGYDSNNPKHVRERQAAAGRKDKRLLTAYRGILSHHTGRELLWELLTMCGVNSDDFSSDPAVLAGNAKARNVGLALGRILRKADKKLYLQMLEENLND
jgi:hypothetical protein